MIKYFSDEWFHSLMIRAINHKRYKVFHNILELENKHIIEVKTRDYSQLELSVINNCF